jgi:hypothetical protein
MHTTHICYHASYALKEKRVKKRKNYIKTGNLERGTASHPIIFYHMIIKDVLPNTSNHRELFLYSCHLCLPSYSLV